MKYAIAFSLSVLAYTTCALVATSANSASPGAAAGGGASVGTGAAVGGISGGATVGTGVTGGTNTGTNVNTGSVSGGIASPIPNNARPGAVGSPPTTNNNQYAPNNAVNYQNRTVGAAGSQNQSVTIDETGRNNATPSTQRTTTNPTRIDEIGRVTTPSNTRSGSNATGTMTVNPSR